MAQEQGRDTTVYNIHAEEIDCVTQEYIVKRSVGDDVYVITAYYTWKPVGLPYVELTKPEYELYMNAPSKFDVNDYGVEFVGFDDCEFREVVVRKNDVAFSYEQYDADQVYLDVKGMIEECNAECLVDEHGWTFVSEAHTVEGAYELVVDCGSQTSSDSD